MAEPKNNWMQAAIDEAKKAVKHAEFPIGAVIVADGQIISYAHNQVETLQNPLKHAEMIAIDTALKKSSTKYLNNADIYVTLEPCLMCYKALSLVKIRRIYVSLANTNDQYSIERLNPKLLDLNHTPQIIYGIAANQMQQVFDKYLLTLRK